MLKRKIKLLKQELDRITNTNKKGIFLVNRQGDHYVVKPTGENTIVFQGNKEEFEKFKEGFEEVTFVIMNIPRPVYPKRNLLE